MARTFNCDSLVPLYLDTVLIERGEYAKDNDKRWLKSFLDNFGARSISQIDARLLLSFRNKLVQRYKATTVNQYLGAAMRFVRWSASMGYRGPVDFEAVKPMRTLPPKRKDWSKAEVGRRIQRAYQADRDLGHQHAISYLACLRPTELIRLVNGEGEWEEEGVFIPSDSKTFAKSGYERRLLLPPTALRLLDETKPRWKNARTFWNASDKQAGFGTHAYRHSSATHLAQAEGYELAKWFLGHYSADKNTLRYAVPNWQKLRELGEVIAENVFAQ